MPFAAGLWPIQKFTPALVDIMIFPPNTLKFLPIHPAMTSVEIAKRIARCLNLTLMGKAP